MTPCTVRSALARTGALALVFGTSFSLTLGSTGVAVAQDPAADAAPSTVQAAVAADGAVTDVKRLGGSGETPSAEDLPVKVDISDTPADGARTLAYHVENTTVKSEDVSYTAPDGTTSSVKQDVALPLVAQLSVRLPATMTEVTALGARVTQLADGSTEVVWSLVLFGPVGSPIQDVTLSAKGEGTPVARLATQAVQPNSTPGLSTTAQAANATINGNGILDTVRNGADEGLGKLAAGVGQLVDGLEKLDAGSNELATGLKAAGDGSNQLADGSEAAKYGSSKLAAGLDQISDGATALSTGAKQLDAGTGTLSAGLDAALVGGKKIAVGGGQLATGAKEASTGATALAAGLAEISAGLGQLSAAQGLPAALDGAKRLQTGVDQLRAGLGSATTEGTILNGLAQTGGGLAQVKGGLDALASPTAGLPAAKGGVDLSKGGVDQVRAGLADSIKTGGAVDTFTAGLTGSRDLVGLALTQLSCATPTATPTATTSCGTLQLASGTLRALVAGYTDPVKGTKAQTTLAVAGLGQVSGGLGQVSAGLGTAVAGVGLLQAGVGQLQAGNVKLVAGVGQVAAGLESGDPTKPGVAEGLDALVTGLTAAVGGVGQLATGSTTAATGATALAVGNGKIAAGNGELATGANALADGLAKLSAGGKQLKAGTGALSTGAGQLATGAGTAATGSHALDEGIGKIAVGQRQVADGLPAAIDGSAQIADGAGKLLDGEKAVAKGIGDVRTQAIGVLASQFKEGTELARQQLAGLDAASAKIASTPGAATTTWVLTQDGDGIVANLASSESDDSGTNGALLGLGGVALAAAGLGGGFLAGRRKAVPTA